MDLGTFFYVFLTIIAFGSLVGLGFGFLGKYRDAKTDEDKRAAKNQYIILLIGTILLFVALYAFLGAYLIPTLNW